MKTPGWGCGLTPVCFPNALAPPSWTQRSSYATSCPDPSPRYPSPSLRPHRRAGTYLADIVFYEDVAKVNKGYKAILVVLNANTRMAYAEPLKKKSDAPAAFSLILERVSKDFTPKTLITDTDAVFTGKAFQSVLRSGG